MKTPPLLPTLVTSAIALVCTALLVAWPPAAEDDHLRAAHLLVASIR